MTIDIIIVLLILISAVILFATEKIPVDLTAIIVMVILLITGIISPSEGISGFSNTATITVGAMFIVSAALQKTGAVNYLGMLTTRLFKSNYWIGLVISMISVGIISAFINNTPVVAVFIPIMLSVASENKLSPTKLLMPISFASMFGGVCTLIGTSTNILVSSISAQNGLGEFGMFEFTTLGVVFFSIGLIYMAVFGIRLIPERKFEGELTEKYKANDYITDIILLPEAKSIGTKAIESPLVKELDIQILDVIRNKIRLRRPLAEITLEPYDELRVLCDIKQIEKLKNRLGVKLKSDFKLKDKDFKDEDLEILEVIVAPNSNLIGKTIKTSRFRNVFRSNALAIRHRGQLFNIGFSDMKLSAGDAILIETRKEDVDYIKNNPNFVLTSEVGFARFNTKKIIPALLIVSLVVLTATFNILPIVVSAIAGCVLLVLTKCISLSEAYNAIDWKIIFLLGGILSLGVAMEKTGAALLLSDSLIKLIGHLGPVAVVAAFYLLTSLLTETMSNNATAVLLAPIAITAAASMGVSPKPFLMAVTFAASASFMTPVGYQTNTMIYSVGQYKFSDFLRVGTPLNIIFWIVATILIPIIFPF